MQPILASHLSELAPVCKKFHVARLEAFGSVLRNDFNFESSDIDFLVEFNETGRQNYADNYFGLLHNLEDILQRQIELVIDSAIDNPFFRDNVDKSKILLYQEV